MYRKKCISCGDSSYSSSRFGQWRCSGCGEDLTAITEELACNKKRETKKKKRTA